MRIGREEIISNLVLKQSRFDPLELAKERLARDLAEDIIGRVIRVEDIPEGKRIVADINIYQWDDFLSRMEYLKEETSPFCFNMVAITLNK